MGAELRQIAWGKGSKKHGEAGAVAPASPCLWSYSVVRVWMGPVAVPAAVVTTNWK
jgi:hypothetical protein